MTRRWTDLTGFAVGVCVLLGLALPASASAVSTLTVSAPANPLRGTPVNVTAAGTAGQVSSVVMEYQVGGTAAPDCGPTLSDQMSRARDMRLGDQDVPAGVYTQSFQITPDRPGPYRVCVYLYPDYVTRVNTNPPLAAAAATFTVPGPAQSLVLAVTNPSPGIGTVETLTAFGTAYDTSSVVLEAAIGAPDCAPTLADQKARTADVGIGDREIPASDYAVQDQYTPTKGGTYRVCAYLYPGYVARMNTNAPLVPVATATFTVPGGPTPTPIPPPKKPGPKCKQVRVRVKVRIHGHTVVRTKLRTRCPKRCKSVRVKVKVRGHTHVKVKRVCQRKH